MKDRGKGIVIIGIGVSLGLAIFLILLAQGWLPNPFQQIPSPSKPSTVSSPSRITPTTIPVTTPAPATIVGTWEGAIGVGQLASSGPLYFRITFSPNHQFAAEPLTSNAFSFSGTWVRCVIDVECLPTSSMYERGEKYTSDNYVVQYQNTNTFITTTTVMSDMVLVKGDTLDFRGTQRRTSPSPFPPATTPTLTPAVKNGIFGVWWCSPNVQQVLQSPGGTHCFRFYENKFVYHAASRGVADPEISWWINDKGQYETSEPTFNYHGNTLEDTWGNVYKWCPYQAETLCLGWGKNLV
jgi:hypothetical protein